MTAVVGALAFMAVSFLLSWRKQRRDRREGILLPSDAGATVRDRARERAAAAGFVPRARLDTKRGEPSDPRADAACEAAVRGAWEPAAALLRGAGTDWWARYQHTARLARLAADDDAWLAAWEKERPDDPDAALVRGESTIRLAWNIRGTRRAHETTREQFRGFHQVLHQARADMARAIELNPQDPTPLAFHIPLSYGLADSHEAMRELWARLVALDPYHFDGHCAALQYWCAKWQGSKELAMTFAEHAAATAPPASMLTLLPLIARYEHADELRRPFTSREARAATDAALAALAAAPEAPAARRLRHYTAFFLARQRRYAEALEQFRLVDGYIGAAPWVYWPNPAVPYEEVRDAMLRKAGRPGGAARVSRRAPARRPS
ncbi:hypothetical protein ACQYWQ_16435 [Streptomyces sp. P6-2-1]|uniref:hypothetical protein n=1 Tax=Streptomyces sp. P6-2-1 TaxID=3422591 RepID=UPI003D360746